MNNIFDGSAPGWYSVRHWSIFRNELEALARRWRVGRLLNVGCAHGPDFLPFRQGFELYGVDFATEMLRFAQKYSRKFDFAANLTVADVRYLPYRNESFDWAISVATYHHIKEKDERLAALQELRRVLKPGGEAFITVWNRWQPRFWLRRKEVTVPWRTRGETLYRYYYLFSFRELETLVKKAGFGILSSSPEYASRFPGKPLSRNLCLRVIKGN